MRQRREGNRCDGVRSARRTAPLFVLMKDVLSHFQGGPLVPSPPRIPHRIKRTNDPFFLLDPLWIKLYKFDLSDRGGKLLF
jgi:hypothetical protein